MRRVWLVLFLGLCIASSAWAQSRFGKVLSLPGDFSYGEVKLTDVLRINGNRFTMECWIKINGNNKQFYIGETRSYSNDYLIMQNVGKWAGAVPRERFFLTNTPIEPGKWHHIALVYDSSEIRFYLNGENIHQEARDGTPIRADGNIYFGSRPTGGQALEGFIDEVRIWRVARTEAQIRATLKDTLGPAYYTTADSGLIGYWRFDQLEDLGVGGDGADDVRDYSIYKHHCDLAKNATIDDSDVPTAAPQTAILPETPRLFQNYPNPFNPGTVIQFELPARSHVRLTIYDLAGRQVAALLDAPLGAGVHRIPWQPTNLSSGMYVYKLQVNQRTVASKKMVYLR